MTKAHLFIVMGVSGSGKSTVAKVLADELNYVSMEADDFHSAEAQLHMSQNKPLTDEHRRPWIAAMLAYLQALAPSCNGVVLAYSGLKKQHRQQFRQLPFHCHYLYLHGEKSVLVKRLEARQDHFFPAKLLDSQFAALEVPLPDETDVSAISFSQNLQQLCKLTIAQAKETIKEVNK